MTVLKSKQQNYEPNQGDLGRSPFGSILTTIWNHLIQFRAILSYLDSIFVKQVFGVRYFFLKVVIKNNFDKKKFAKTNCYLNFIETKNLWKQNLVEKKFDKKK